MPSSPTPSAPITPDTVARMSAESLLDLENQLCFAVYSASHAFNRAYKPLLKGLGLTYPQYLVMLVLWEMGAVTVGDIGHRLMLDSGTLTPLLKRMESAGLVDRRRDSEDERQVKIHLTEKGWALREQAVDVPRTLLCAVGDDLEELASLRRDLHILRTRLEALGG